MGKKSSISKLDKVVAQEPVNTSVSVNPNRQAEILAECDRQGLTLSHLVKTIYDASQAIKITYDKLGNVVGEEEDHATRLRAASIGFDLRGETNSKANVNVQTTMIAVIETLSSTAKSRLAEWKRENLNGAKTDVIDTTND